ncbi:Uncharacterized protein ehr_00412 [Ehrlichia minasensis]|nr:Uncharacterized protein ehr_00412 [Ehrlichia minasensis]
MCDRSLNIVYCSLLALLALLIIILLCIVIYKCHIDRRNERRHDGEVEQIKLQLKKQYQAILKPESVDVKKIEEKCREELKDQLEEQQKTNNELKNKLELLEKVNVRLEELVSSLRKDGVRLGKQNADLTECLSKMRKDYAQLGVLCRKLECDRKNLLRAGKAYVDGAMFNSFTEAVDGMLAMCSKLDLLLVKKNNLLDSETRNSLEFHAASMRTILMDLEEREKKDVQPTQPVQGASVLPHDMQGNGKAA